jgi:hypothetical protein
MNRSGWKIGRPDVDSVGMKRPIAKRLGLAEHLLGKFPGVAFIRGVDFEGTLTDFSLSAVIAEHVLHESNDKSRHGTSCQDLLLVRWPMYFHSTKQVLTDIKTSQLSPPARRFRSRAHGSPARPA